jgi:hypothetical protein
VFRHFIRTVVDDPPAKVTSKPAPRQDTVAVPRTKLASWMTSWILPYVGVVALLFLGAFVLYKAVTTAIDPEGWTYSSVQIAKGVAGLAILLFGVTVGARVPRLTRSLPWRLLGFSITVLSTAVYVLSWTDVKTLTSPALWTPGGSLNVVFGMGIVVAVGVIGVFRPNWGAKPMIALGAIAVAVTLIWILKDVENSGPAWPVVIAAVAFLYLWWLAALLFDLVVVWHLYIRSSLVNRQLKAMTRKKPHDVLANVRVSPAPASSLS